MREIKKLPDYGKSQWFGNEKDNSFHGALNAIYQTAFGEDLYPSVEEKAELGVLLNHVILDQDLPIKIHGLEKYSQDRMHQSEQDRIVFDDRQVKRVKLLSYFSIYGFLTVIAALALVGRSMFDTEYGLVLGIACGLLMMSIYLTIGTIYRFRHIYCKHQNLKRERMTPNDIYWNTIPKKDLYGIPMLFMSLGLVSLLQVYWD